MEPGTLRHLVKIEAPATVQDEYGEPVAGWSQFAEVFASREDMTGRELFAAQQIKAEVSTRFRLRYLEGVTAKMRISSDGVLYDIASVADPDGRRAELVIIAARGN